MNRQSARVILGVGLNADEVLIRQAYRRRMRSLHPDHSGIDTPQSHAAMAELLEAYRCLVVSAPEVVGPSTPATSTPRAAPGPRGTTGRPRPGHLRSTLAVCVVFASVLFVLFFLLAFSQSGR